MNPNKSLDPPVTVRQKSGCGHIVVYVDKVREHVFVDYYGGK